MGSSLLYLVARTAGAMLLLVQRWRTTGEVLPAVGQLLSDICASLFVLGFVDAGFEAEFGRWWLPLFLYSLAWEAARLRHSYDEMLGDPSADDPATVQVVGAPLGWAWALAGVLPPLAAGAFLVVRTAIASG